MMYFVADWKTAIVYCLWAYPQLVSSLYLAAAPEDAYAVKI